METVEVEKSVEVKDEVEKSVGPIIDWSTAVPKKLRGKYLVTTPCKFGGKKKKASNSGGVGRPGRRAKRRGKNR